MNGYKKKELTSFIKSSAFNLGFSFCGISKVRELDEASSRLKEWLKGKMHGKMHYMENHLDKRSNPFLLVENAKSVISVLYNYYPANPLPSQNHYRISKYAYGTDYHHIIKDKLKQVIEQLRSETGHLEARAFVDSAPVLEKAWAQNAGLGWIGKNSCLINRKKGSFFFIGEIITDLDLEYDSPEKDRCGSCQLCVEACPTHAIVEPYVVDATKCISYLTIENRDELPEKYKNEFENWIFGCDICQDVCPWNRFSEPHKEKKFCFSPELVSMTKTKWEKLAIKEFNIIFNKSAVKRAKFRGLKRNIDFLKKG